MQDIHTAYEREYTKWHPNVTTGNEEHFKKIIQAYDILSDPHTRTAYDSYGKSLVAEAAEANEEEWENTRTYVEDQLRGWYRNNPLITRSNKSAYATYKDGLETTWGVAVSAAQLRTCPSNAIRIIAVRHGMGMHNESLGVTSVANRDAQLVPEVGTLQAKETGQRLADLGVFMPPISDSLLVVISPFRRTLQTALDLIGEDMWTYPTVVTPLAAEHSYEISALQQGDRGSKTRQLRAWFPPEKHPQFHYFTEVDQYCEDKQIEDGKWWAHGPGWAETPSSFRARAEEFREFLFKRASDVGARTVLVVSHGGLLHEAFNKVKYDNCEFRCFDLFSDSSFRLVGCAHGESETTGEGGCTECMGVNPMDDAAVQCALVIRRVVQLSRDKKGYHYHIKGSLNGRELDCKFRLSEMRERLKDRIKAQVSRATYNKLGDFPSKQCSHLLVMTYLVPWLQEVSKHTAIYSGGNRESAIIKRIATEFFSEGCKRDT
eukprot:CAMPEP_0185038558 /NCGR_PEP_ID=MMETSP1103-20130426/34340_1 /TAXON_ID=36769 /ORGANISM="Paraphysomonas bandaiensis, Strain Caron Lab Isolate" /LENGTH=488 /DNA_ID=CAMNT_0027577037 /DNA_START=40 /DNA_END=1506 /DNA_ORIENTATION=-